MRHIVPRSLVGVEGGPAHAGIDLGTSERRSRKFFDGGPAHAGIDPVLPASSGDSMRYEGGPAHAGIDLPKGEVEGLEEILVAPHTRG